MAKPLIQMALDSLDFDATVALANKWLHMLIFLKSEHHVSNTMA